MNDIKRLLTDEKVPFIERGPSVTKGWVGVNCPYCGDDHFHMGYNLRSSLFSCWRCGVKPFLKTLSLLTEKPITELKVLLPSYYIAPDPGDEEKEVIHAKELSLPREAGDLTTRHKRYLKGRGFDWRELATIWGLKGTLDEGAYSNRIIIPIFYQKKLVSFTSRDITDRHKIKALTCPEEKEVIHAKHIVHGFDLVRGNTVVVMEGPFDSFRYGPGAVDVQGIKFTERQIELLGAFKNIFICFDSIINDYGKEEEKRAQEQAERLADSLSVNCNVWVLDQFKSDPGSMSQRQMSRMKRKIEETLKNLKEEQR